MTRLLISTAIAGLLALSGPALAQGRGDAHRDDHNRPAPAAAPAGPAPQQAERPQIGGRNGRGNPGQFNQNQAAQNTPPAQQDRRQREDRRPSAGAQNAPAAQPAPQQAMRAQGPSTDTRGPATDRRAFDNNNRGNNNNLSRGNNDQRGSNDRRAFSNNQGRDFSSFHRNFSAPHRFRTTTYRRPSGWYSHRWVFGEILPALFWSQNYWLDDYVDFGLAPPPPGTVWVRDGDDALLIDRFSGEIIQVEYSVFY